MSALAGQIASPSDYNDDTRKVIARGNRVTTSSNSTGSEVEVLRLDGVPVIAGHLYRVSTSGLIPNSTVAGDLIEVFLRYSTTGTATAASAKITSLAENSRTASGAQFVHSIQGFIPIAATGPISVLLSFARTAGSGTCNIAAQAAYPLDLVVDDMGVDPGNTGVSL